MNKPSSLHRNGKLRVAVLCGGPSSEHEVSLASGKNVFKALDRNQFQPELVSWGKDHLLVDVKIDFSKFDVVFLALHGPFGEDGRIQAFFDLLGVPYTGSGLAASALGMDKVASKRMFQAVGIPTPEFAVVSDLVSGAGGVERIGLPCVVKPSSQGSSVGVSLVEARKDIEPALRGAISFDGRAIVERYVKGREFSVGVLGNGSPQALPLIEVIPKGEFFDYEAKYVPGMAKEITPARLDSRKTRELQDLAVKVFRVLGCRGFGRVDMLLDERGETCVLEINTIPGMTENSLFPKEAKAAGISFPQLVGRIIDLALE